jgi:hypothetical protein
LVKHNIIIYIIKMSFKISTTTSSNVLGLLTNAGALNGVPVVTDGSQNNDNLVFANGSWVNAPPVEVLDTATSISSTISTSLLDTSSGPIVYTLPDAEEGTRKTIRLLKQNIVHDAIIQGTSGGRFTLTSTDLCRSLIFYNGQWNVNTENTFQFYPNSQQGSKLVGSGAIGAAQQGTSVALSGDGKTLVVGGPDDNSLTGAAWIFNRIGTQWQQVAKLVGTGSVGPSQQGGVVAIDFKGTTIASGGLGDDSQNGAVWVFTKSSDGSWAQQGSKLTGSDATAGAKQGNAVSLSGDGNTLAFGGVEDSTSVGAAWVFKRTGSGWTQQGNKLVGTGGVSQQGQGSGVSLSLDGNTLASGGFKDAAFTGAIWVFTRSGDVWSQQGNKITATGTVPPSALGGPALSSDGNTLAAGAILDDSLKGAAFVFTRVNGVWTQQAKLVATDSSVQAYQGVNVSITSDGNTLLVGSAEDSSGIGGFWVYTRTDGVWTQQGDKRVGTGNVGNAKHGYVSVSSNGSTAVLGGPEDASSTGAVWTFV